MVILLLKSPNPHPDSYTRCFECCNHQILHLPVLQHSFVNVQQLCQQLSLLNFSALIVTSQRAVAAINLVLDSLSSAQKESLNALPVYTVGPATHAALAAVGFTDIRGWESGNGSVLADYIIEHHSLDKPLLFLVGDRRRDVVPTKLALANKPFKELVVYESAAVPDLSLRFTELLTQHIVDWIVFFSPLGAEIVLSVHDCSQFKVAAIGPTTEKYLLSHNITPDVVAVSPDPQSLLDGINAFEEKV